MPLAYSYAKARIQCYNAGLVFDEEMAEIADASFALARLTQNQVDAVMNTHIFAVRRLFSPGNYTLKQRLLMALHFIFGRKQI